MHSLRLKIDEKIYDKLLMLLNKFSKDELEIIVDDENFENNKKYLESELNEILDGTAKFYSVNEVEQRLESVVKKHEDYL
jgi:hypothetical protein